MNNTSYNPGERELDRNFKIPRRSFNDDNYSGKNSIFDTKTLDDAYDPCEPNMQRHSPGSFEHPNSFRGYQQHENNLSAPLSDYDALPSFPHANFQTKEGSFHANQPGSYNYHFNTLKRPREVPKNSNGSKYGDSFPHRSDPSLPKELMEQFQPLYCKLCVAQLSSNTMAKMHYKSKNHEKKVRKFLTEYSERTGESLHIRAQISNCKKQKLEEDNDPKYFHCDVCDLPLTGRLHAESHYMGRNHQKALAGKAPAGKGHFNVEGKWVRRSTTVPSERDNFGLDFVSPTESAIPTCSVPAECSVPPVCSVRAEFTLSGEFASAKEDFKDKSRHCEMCDVKVTSDQQMALHVSGQKHKKRLQQLANDNRNENSEGDPENNILSTLASNSVPSGDLSVYRTPTGYYYCNPCNLSLNSEIQFKQHLGSKKHRKKASGNKD